MGLFNIKGKKALVTGSGRGIGLAVAEGFLKSGCKVGGFDKQFDDEIDKKVSRFTLDLSEKDEIKQSFKDFLYNFESIDILVNCAGVTISNSSENYKYDDWLTTIEVNLNAAFFLSKLVGNQMIKQNSGGSIINVTSIGAEQGFPSNPAYCSAKGGLKQLTKALALDWGKYGIRVNNLIPGYTNTPMNAKSWNNDVLHKARSDLTMLGRWAEPEEMVGPAIFLASEASSYITGSDLFVDGGWVSKGM